MAKKPTVTTLQSGFNSTEVLNSNFEALRDAFDNTLSLDGSIPNAMEADLDLNGNNLIGATGLLINGTDYLADVEAAKTAALVAQAAAETAETNAETAETNAESSETNASASATASQTSATASQVSRLAAELAETNAAASESNAATSETNAAVSATTASTGASTATTKASEAFTSATNAANSATAASLSETNASTSESNASASETNALTSETNAVASATTATTKASEAVASATAAATSETNAAASAATATTGASTATTQAGIATTKAGEASASATAAAASAASIVGAEANAANSAVQAAASQVAAATSAASAANVFDTFDDKYLGSKTSEPTTDNDGDPLAVGALFYNQTSGGMFVWDGASWVAASSAGGVSLNYFYYTATAGQTTFSGLDDNSATLAYTLDNIIVTLNGIILENGTDYTANTATSIVLTSGAALNDELNILAFKSFTTADMVSATTGGTFAADVTFLNNIIVNGTVDGRDVAADGALAASAVQPSDLATVATTGAYSDLTGSPTLATVATSGAYSDLTGLPTLGTAASTASTDYATAAQGTLADTAVQPNDSPTFNEVSLNKLNDANGDEALTITSNSTVQVHNEIEFIGNTGLNAHIQKNAASGRDELQIYAATDANGAGSRGAGMHLYGNSDNEHDGNVAFITGPNDGGEGRMFVSGWDTNTHVTIGNGPTGQTIWQFVDNQNDKALLNLINPTGGPALFFMEANGSTEGDITVNDGETLHFGHWNYTTSTYTNRMAMTPTGFDVLGGITAGGDVTVDTTTLHVDSTNHRVGIGTITPTNQLNIEDSGDVKVAVKSTGTGDADATLVLDSADTGESVVQFEHDGVYGARIEWFTDGSPDLNINTVGATSVIDMQPNGVRTGRFDTSGLEVTGTVTATSYSGDGSNLTGIAAGAGGGGSDEIFWENGQNVTSNYTITNGKNAMSAGPITINNGVTVTVGAGETWTVV